MGSRIVILLLLCVWLFCEDLLLSVVSRELSNEEDVELENQVRLLNKPAVTTIRTKYDEDYDCVDFYKQRAFDHPALKNHNFHPQMRPSSYPAEGRLYQNSLMTNQFDGLWLNGEGCPIGTVPVKRVTKDQLLKIKLAEKIYAQAYDTTTDQEHGTHYAMLRTKNRELYGAGMETSVYNPQGVTDFQYSSSQVKISNGVDSIEAGWTVNPSVNGDTHTRLFVYTKTGASACLNTYCPGFVYTDRLIPIDATLGPLSQSGGRIYGATFFIYKNNEKWWLQVSPANMTIGFWPEAIFTDLKVFATAAEWGGKVYSPPNIPIPSPPMGAGNEELREDIFYDAFCNITTVDESNQILTATDTSPYADNEQYQVKDLKTYGRQKGHILVFGGPEGYTTGN